MSVAGWDFQKSRQISSWNAEIACMTQNVLSRLRQDPRCWHDLQFLTVGRPLAGEAAASFWQTVVATEFADLWREHPRAAAVGLLVAAKQLGTSTPPEMKERLESQVVACARILSEGEPIDEPVEGEESPETGSVWAQAPFVLLEAALYISSAVTGGIEEAAQRFHDLVAALVREYPALAAKYRDFIIDSCQDMSAAAAQRLAPLVHFLRCQE